jgi:hypothetical protein
MMSPQYVVDESGKHVSVILPMVGASVSETTVLSTR